MRDSKEMNNLPTDIAYLLGEQWPTNRPKYKASPVNNRLMRSMEQTVAILTDIRPTFEVKANDAIFDDQATLLTKTVKCWWADNDVDFQLAMSIIYAYLTTGFLRIVWNKQLCNGRGDFQVYPLSPFEVKPIGPAHRFGDWEGAIYESVRNVAWFRRMFPGPGSSVQADMALSRYAKPMMRPNNMSSAGFDQLSLQAQRWVGSPREFGESAIAQAWYREFWIRDYSINTSNNVIQMGTPNTNWAYEVKPGYPLYPRGRLIITGGGPMHVMYDGPNYFWHGKFPFIPIRLKPVPWQFHGISELRSKIPLQDIVNSILAGTLDMIKKSINPALMFPDDAFSDAIKNTLDPNMPNAKIGYNPMSPGKPEWQSPPQLPSYVQNTLLYSQNEMDDDSGLLDLGGLARKKVTPAGDTLQGLKESQQTIMRLRGRFVEISVGDLGDQMVPNFCQFYTLSRRMWMFGRSGVTSQDVFDANMASLVPHGRDPAHHAMGFSFKIVPGSLLNLDKNDNRMMAMALRRQGDMDRKTMYTEINLPELYSNVEKGLKQEQQDQLKLQQQAQAGAMAAQMGAPPPSIAPPPGGQAPVHDGKGSDNPANLLVAR